MRQLIVELGGRYLGTEIQLDEVHVGWGVFEFAGLAILEPADALVDEAQRPQLKVNRVQVKVEPLKNWLNGVFVRQLMVDSPEIHLRFDEQGQLLSQFPKIPESDDENSSPTLPFRRIDLANAKMIVHQAGRPTLTLIGDRLSIQASDRNAIQGTVNDLLGGTVRLAVDVDADTFEGRTVLTCRKIAIDTETLSQWPLMPPVVRDHQVAGIGALDFEIQHPAREHDLRKHVASLRARVEQIEVGSIEGIPQGVDVFARLKDGRIDAKIEVIESAGTLTMQAQSDLMRTPTKVCIAAEANQVDLQPVMAAVTKTLASFPHVASFPTVAGIGDLSANATLMITASGVAFDCRGTTRVSQIELDPWKIGDVRSHGHVKGEYAWSSADPLTGIATAQVDWDGIQLDQLRPLLAAEDVEGSIQGSCQMAMPLDLPGDLNSVAFDGQIEFNGITCRGLSIADHSIRAELSQGNLVVAMPVTTISDSIHRKVATIDGEIRASITEQREVVVDFHANDLSTKSLVRLLGQSDEGFGGEFSASLSATAGLDRAADPAAWNANARLRWRDMQLMNERLSNVDASCLLQNGAIEVPEVSVQWRNTICRFGLKGLIDDNYTIEGGFSTSPVLLTDLSAALRCYSNSELPLRGAADATGRFKFQLQPFQFEVAGQSHLRDARYATHPIGSAVLAWSADPRGLKLEHTSLDLLGGSSSLTLHVQELDWTKTVIEGKFQEISTERLAAFTGNSLQAKGLVEGGFRIHSIENLESVRGHAWIDCRGVSVRRVPFEISTGTIEIENGRALLSSTGQISTGSYSMMAQCELRELLEFAQHSERRIQQIPVRIEASTSGVPLQRLIAATGFAERSLPISGRSSFVFVRDEACIRDGLIGNATCTAESLSWNRSRLSEYVTAEIAVSLDRVTLRRFQGQFADGQLNGKADVSLINGKPRGNFELSAMNVNLRRASTPILGSRNAATGIGSVRLRGRLDSTVNGQLNVDGDNVEFVGVCIDRVRLPIDWSCSLDSRVARWQLRAGTIEAGGGRIHIDSEGDYSRSLTMNSSARIEHVDSARLMRGRSLGVGIIDGNCTLQARRNNSLDRMTGTFDIELSKTRAMEMPILDQLSQVIRVPAIGTGNGDQQGGYLYGRLGSGLIHLEELALTQNNIHVLMSGTSTLDGRLDLEVSASTKSDGPIDDLLALVDTPVMAAGAAPVVMVARANDALKNRVVHVDISGTAQRPSIRLNPGKQLSQDAIQFFLKASVGTQIADAATSYQRGRRPNR